MKLLAVLGLVLMRHAACSDDASQVQPDPSEAAVAHEGAQDGAQEDAQEGAQDGAEDGAQDGAQDGDDGDADAADEHQRQPKKLAHTSSVPWPMVCNFIVRVVDGPAGTVVVVAKRDCPD